MPCLQQTPLVKKEEAAEEIAERGSANRKGLIGAGRRSWLCVKNEKIQRKCKE